jgi:CRP/FNR family cyclic AMP-dependent transcriptional regulator
MSPIGILKNIYLFKSLDESDLIAVNKIATEKTFTAGQDIFVTGQEAQSFFVIRMGTIKIYSNPDGSGDLNIANLGSGSHFGELPLMDGGKRSATAQATENSTLLEINYDKLRALLTGNDRMAHRFFRDLSHFMAARLRATTENLQHIHELRLKHF